ncbi:Vta1 like-domain-containing protein [Amylocarpus encephaloides]|uniref:Vta1 like-domain-containing protein n=1 Tax=Amylocarpus encephaloides TaxID=45428 RepID=A0A9P8C3M2_9HELO|nr:Vta1 like-domain-containing protein [Amylocarpus encephaloides]
MAANIPAKLKTADLTRFIVRAGQLEKAKPVIAYWCEYWIVNQILSKGLHNGDAETLEYTTTLMDKLEQIKSDNASNDAIIDDTAGQAYVEQFALETFQRADRTVQADKVTKQTADTFQAAATFLELANIWGLPDAQALAKIKYAKWNVVRIITALKEGKDPNESNPKQEPAPEENLPALDPNDPEVQLLGEATHARQPSVEDAPDEQDQIDARLAPQSTIDQSLHPSAQVSARQSPGATSSFEPYPRDGFPYTAVQDDNVSPLEPSPNMRNGSVGGGYFPEVPTFTAETQHPTVPTAPDADDLDLGLPEQPSNAPGASITPDFESFPPPTISQPPPEVSPQDFYNPPPSVQHFAPPPVAPIPQRVPPPQQFQPPPPLVPQISQPTNQKYNIDDASVAKAQKHAKWAISALNFEDGETAVKELRAALRTLGAQ